MKQTFAVVLAVTVLAGVVGCAAAATKKPAPTRPTLTLADSAWPCEGHDAQHTNRSAAIGPDRPVEKRVLSAHSPVVGPDGTLYSDSVNPSGFGAIDPSSGSTKWRVWKNLDYGCVPAVLSNETAVFASVDKGVQSRSYAFAIDGSGHELWRTWLGRGMVDCDGDLVGVSGPTIGRDGTVYVTVTLRNGKGSTEGTLYAIDPSDGSIRWEFSVVTTDFRTPVIGLDGTIYVPDYSRDQLYAINPDGSRRWRFSAGWFAGDPAVGRDGTVYVLAGGGLVAINPDGSEKWRVPTTAQGSLAIGPTGTVYGVGQALYAISSDGRELWSMPVKNFTRAIVDGAGTIYVCDGQWLRAVNPDGSQKWRFESGESSELRIGPNKTIIVGGTMIGSAGNGGKQ